MTTHRQHSDLGAWTGLAVGLALACGGWVLWEQLWARTIRDARATGIQHAWDTPLTNWAVLVFLVVFALLCALAGAMIGRRSTAETA